MKCPKCHYLSFDPEPRCRNCGYTLSLDQDFAISTAADDEEPLFDLALKQATETEAPPAPVRRQPVTPQASDTARRARTSAPGPFDEGAGNEFMSETDFELRGREEADDAAAPQPIAPPPVPAAEPSRTRPAAKPPSVPAPATAELPLFMQGAPREAARTPDAPARPPAIVESKAPEIPAAPPPRPVTRPVKADDRPLITRRDEPPARLGPLDRDLLEGLQRIEHFEQANSAAEERRTRLEHSVGAMKRIAAAVVDALLLTGLAAGLLWITLRWCDLSWQQATAVPPVPFGLFVLVLIVGYLFLFTTASGQTVGKMVAGIRVVDAGVPGDAQAPVSMRQAMYRGVVAVPSVLILGAGFIPALFGDERAFHDRVTHTRVIRA